MSDPYAWADRPEYRELLARLGAAGAVPDALARLARRPAVRPDKPRLSIAELAALKRH